MIDKSIILSCAQNRAFELFTEQASYWWPPERRHLKDPNSRIEIRPESGFVETSDDGRQVTLGRVKVWQPPERLVLDFFVGTGPEEPTEVEITFTPSGDGTEVRVVHRAFPQNPEAFEGKVHIFQASWTSVLDALHAAAQSS